MRCGSDSAGALVEKALWALILSAKLVKRRPDGRYIVKKLEDADEAREKASSMSSPSLHIFFIPT